MKSIIQEASTIQKAIENAWEQAGKPDEFTIKVLEAPETNFFGLKTVKAAKIAFYFGEAGKTVVKGQIRPLKVSNPRPQNQEAAPEQPQRARQPHQARPQQQHRQDNRPERRDQNHRDQNHRDQSHRDQNHKNMNRPTHAQDQSQESRSSGPDNRDSRHHQQRRPYDTAAWNEEMMQTALEWVKDAISELGRSDITITPHLSHNYYKLRLNMPVAPDAQQSEMILKSWGNLSMESVREKFKQPLRNLRVIVEQSTHVRSN